MRITVCGFVLLEGGCVKVATLCGLLWLSI